MMDNVEIPKKPRFVTDPMKYVIDQIVNEKKSYPRPPCVGWKLERGYRIAKCVDIAVKKAEKKPPYHTHETQENIYPCVLIVPVFVRMSATRKKCLHRDH